jgi:hypothetical protein
MMIISYKNHQIKKWDNLSLIYPKFGCCKFIRRFILFVFSDVEFMFVSDVRYQFEWMNILF